MKKFALIGHNISYSLSPKIHGEIFRTLGEEATYELISVSPGELPGIIPYLRTLDGFNVTKPHKESLGAYLEAGAPESINTVAVRGGKMYGYSTDGYGFTRDIKIKFGEVSGTALVLGAGGAARVIAAELSRAGLDVYIHNRTKEKAESLASELGVKSLDSLGDAAPDLIVNCTSFGLNRGENPALVGGRLAVDDSRLKWAYDTIYSPPETDFLRSFPRAKRSNGFGMLILQAIEADRIFLGRQISAEEEQKLYSHFMATLGENAGADEEKN